MKTICLTTLPIILILSFGVMSSQATPTPAVVDITNDFISDLKGDYVYGWAFNVSQPITVTQLGFFDLGYYDPTQYDPNQYGMLDSHQVAIYNANDTANPLVSGTVFPNDPLTGYFRYTSSLSTTTMLLPGNNYVIATVTGQDYYVYDPSGATFGPEILFTENRNASSSTLVFPWDTSFFFIYGNFGPDFQYEAVAAVPEPGTMFLLGSGLIGLFILRRRFKE